MSEQILLFSKSLSSMSLFISLLWPHVSPQDVYIGEVWPTPMTMSVKEFPEGS